jgi:hypothetical protein
MGCRKTKFVLFYYRQKLRNKVIIVELFIRNSKKIKRNRIGFR